ncbi:unnamed protein product [Gordionus sp. m RMFG-2023]
MLTKEAFDNHGGERGDVQMILNPKLDDTILKVASSSDFPNELTTELDIERDKYPLTSIQNVSRSIPSVSSVPIPTLTARGLDLRPPYFNLAEGRKVEASATCGVGVQSPELYCKLIGATSSELWTRPHLNIIQGQICDYCQPDDHPAEYAVDGTERWWQSPPLSRGHEYNEVNFTIDLGQSFHVAYVFMKMANSPRPAVWILDRSKDQGKTWLPWQYFADTDSNCKIYFGENVKKTIEYDDDVICTTEFSNVVPLEGGEIAISLINHRPNAQNFSYATRLQEFTRATNIRLRLLRTKTLLGHLMALTRQDSSVTRRYFYSIKDISIGGRCVCNGHADTCDKTDLTNPYKLACRCQHDTCGPQCEFCCSGFRQKPWKPSTFDSVNSCEACNCLGHSNDCDYDAEVDRKSLSLDIFGNYNGGGVCKDCQHNTQGINCNQCVARYYRPHGNLLNSTNVCVPCVCDSYYSTGLCSEGDGTCECKANFTGPYCQMCNKGYYDFPSCKPCECFGNGTTGEICQYQDGYCPCKYNYQGKSCHQCTPGYFNFPNCERCVCDRTGSLDYFCDQGSGQCKCRNNYGGLHCDACADGYFNYPTCEFCSCDTSGTVPEVCDKSNSQCLCKKGYTGSRCEKCETGFYGYPDCKKCKCSDIGSIGNECEISGQCYCKTNFSGIKCDQCAAGYHEYPVCKSCDCNVYGSQGRNCDETGTCWCNHNFDGSKCKTCKEGFYNFPICEECNCDPAGIIYNFLGCGAMKDGVLCQCKQRVMGHICDKCKPLYWNLKLSNPLGCEDCGCDLRGVISGYRDCDPHNGQCVCKANVDSRTCGECKDGFYNLERGNIFGCTSCQCNPGGSLNNVCDKNTGQCPCLPRIDGKTCDRSIGNHYIPLLNHLRFELEDGRNPDGNTRVRYAYDDNVFPKYSWRGYAIFSELQPKIIMDVSSIPHGLYRLVARYVNRNDYPVFMDVSVRNRLGHDQHTFPHFPRDPFYNPHQFQITSREYTPSVIQTNEITLDPNTIIIDKAHHGYVSSPRFVYAQTPTSTSPNSMATKYKIQDVAASKSKSAASFVIDSNTIEVIFELKNHKDSAFMDYFTLIPSEYYEAGKLQYQIEDVCKLEGSNKQLCRQYTYPPLDSSDYPEIKITYGDQSFLLDKTAYWRNLAEMTGDIKLIQGLNLTNDMVKLDSSQTEVYFDFKLEPNDYNFIITYYSPGEKTPENLETSIINPQTKEEVSGHVILNNCHNKLICRQVVLNNEGKILTYSVRPSSHQGPNQVNPQLTEGNVQIGFRMLLDPDYIQHSGRKGSDLALASVVAIPSKYWNIDLVKPTLLSINNNEHEIISNYDQIGTFRYGIEDVDKNISSLNSKTINSVNYTKIAAKMNHTINVLLPKAGDYVIILKYYQNRYPSFSVGIDIQGNKTKILGTFDLEYCPNEDGCYAIFKDKTLQHVFGLPETFNLTIFHQSPYLFWLNNIIFMPSDLYRNSWVNHQPIDQTHRFIEGCEKVFLDEDTLSQNPFCKKAIFSLSTDFNLGAKQCNCDNQGSISYSCNPVGGQCQCKDNIIGRTCLRCKSGYFGFPNCRKCPCPFSLCDEVTGKCLCPPRVKGVRCDNCEPKTFGYDPIIGCEPCDCNQAGVLNAENLDCDLLTGQCGCRPNVINRNCSQCQVGTYGFPYCQSCNCDSRGVTEDYCDQYTSACYCKENTEGPRCSKCKPGTFLLEGINPKGCTNCFCFGVTQICENSDLYWNDLVVLYDWKIANVSEDLSISSLRVDPNQRTLIIKDLLKYANQDGVYLSAPSQYLGNKIKSYGGILSYELYIRADDSYNNVIIHPTLLLKGANMSIAHYSDHQPIPNAPYHIKVILSEMMFEHSYETSHFQHYNKRQIFKTVTREQMMVILSSLEEILVLVHYFPNNFETHFKNPLMEIALSSSNPGSIRDENRLALSVERCKCPINYAGTSCELCGPGFYRKSTNISKGLASLVIGGLCMPCQCNGHSDVCEDETGKCLSCNHHTTGDNCELCKPSYYGDATMGTPNDCHICPCPLPLVSNNFATSCEIKDVGQRYTVITCKCKDNYVGMNCERCAPGYFGQPFKVNESCKPCQCNQNLDMSNPEACDSVNGVCLVCGKNTAGPSCNLCSPGHFGNAITGKCERCSCNMCGSNCDTLTGRCVCHDKVVGPQCDKCAPGFYDFDSCVGCMACNCSSGAVSHECDLTTGQCECKPGTTGKYCEKCLNGFWNYGLNGCTPCECASLGSVGIQCDAKTGQCSCLSGVTGEKCDQCEARHILMPNQGCQPCDNCVHTLLDDVELQARNLKEIMADMNEISEGIFATKRLTQINNTIMHLRPLMQNIIGGDTTMFGQDGHSMVTKRFRDSTKEKSVDKIDIDPVKGALLSLNVQSQYIQGKVDNLESNSQSTKAKLHNLTEGIRNTEDLLSELHRSIYNAIIRTSNVENAIKLNRIQGNTDALLEQAQRMFQFLDHISFNSSELELRDEIDKVYELLYKVQFLEFAPKQLEESIVSLMKELGQSMDKMREIINFSTESTNTTKSVQDILMQLNPSEIKQLVADASSEKLELADVLKEAAKLLVETKSAYINASKNIQQLEQIIKISDTNIKRLQKDFMLESNSQTPPIDQGNAASKYFNFEPELSKINDHTQNLEREADNLVKIFTPTRKAADPAKKAATVYETITELITNASWKANSAEIEVQSSEAFGKEEDLFFGNGSRQIFINSRETLARAREASNNVEFSSRDNIVELKTELEQNEDRLSELARETEILEENLKITIESHNNLENLGEVKNATYELSRIYQVLHKTDQISDRFKNLSRHLNLTMDMLKSTPSYLTSKGGEEMMGQIRDVVDILPKIANSASLLENRIKHMDQSNRVLEDEIDSLFKMISQARVQAEQINLGVATTGSQYIVLKNPEHLTEATSHTNLEGYFKTGAKNGLLFYAGLPYSPLSSSQDFFALLIENGYPKFYFDLGNGPAVITSGKYAADNRWHKFQAERAGTKGKLIINSKPTLSNEQKNRHIADDIDIAQGSAMGPNNILNFDNNNTKIYVAGLPLNAKLADILGNPRNFKGCLDSLMLNRQLLSLWNFAEASDGIKACKEREVWFNEVYESKSIYSHANNSTYHVSTQKIDHLSKPKSYQHEHGLGTSKAYNFDGTDFTTVSKGKYNPMNRSHLGLSFKSFSPNGLILYAKGYNNYPKDYLAIEMNDGLILYHFNLGSGSTVLVTTVRVDDGEWHTLEADRDGKIALLKLDGEEVAKTESPGSHKHLQIQEDIYIGGVPDSLASSLGLTHKKFKGCLMNIQLGKNYIDFGNKPHPGVSLGCSSINSALVNFPPYSKGYIQLPIGYINYSIKLNMRFKTLSESSLLVFSANQDRSDVFALVILNGNVVLISKNNQNTYTLSTYDANKSFNDGQWHNLNAIKNETSLHLNIDDLVDYGIPAPNQKIDTTSPLFIGGISPLYHAVVDNFTGAPDSSLYFAGCLSDVFINNELLDFTYINPENRPNVLIGECQDDYLNYSLPKSKITNINQQFDGECLLPLKPAKLSASEIDADTGFSFQEPGSRLEYDSPPAKHKFRHEFSIKIKTQEPSGIIFYVANNNQRDYIYLGLDSGLLVYAFITNSTPCIIKSPVESKRLDDDTWHSIIFKREAGKGELIVDKELSGTCKAENAPRTLNISAPYFVGGIPQYIAQTADMSIIKQNYNYKGCIKQIMLNSIPLGIPTRQYNIDKCYALAEPGVFFPGKKSYVIIDDFSVEEILNIKVEIKPRIMTGTIFTITSMEGLYMNLQLDHGDLVFSFDMGHGPVKTTFPKLKSDINICDGRWHSIEAIKAQNIATLSLDGKFVEPTENYQDLLKVLKGKLYMGAVPDDYMGNPGLKNRNSYVGCIKEISFNAQVVNLSEKERNGDISLKSCPIT